MMTREEAIKRLRQYQGYEPGDYGQIVKHSFDLSDETVDTLLSALRPVSREQVERMRSGWITVAETNGKQYSKCADCQNALDGLEDAYLFCPHCGAPMTDEAVEMVMERMEVLKDGKSD